MATFTITTAVNIDSLASKAGSDTYNINGGYLTVDQDTRWGVNQSTTAGMGNITLSATLGGTIEFNATAVRIIPFDTGTGNVPAYGTTISQGGASGILIGVFDTLASGASTPGAGMPVNGFIKIKQWNSVAYSSGALTGIGANATAADRVGWLHIVGIDTLTTTCNRLGLFKVTGDWFEVGTTDGNRATTYQIPSDNTLVYFGGVQVETSAGSGIYEWYPCAGSRTALPANVAVDALRGKVCWISSAGLLRFGHDGTNSTGGYCPATGCNIRMPNIFFQTATSGSGAANVLPNTTITSRMEFATSGGGKLEIDKCCMNWYLNCSQAYSVNISDTAIVSGCTMSEIASPMIWDSVCIGQEGTLSIQCLSLTTCLAGGTFTDCKFLRAGVSASTNYMISADTISGFDFDNIHLSALGVRGNAGTASVFATRMTDCTFTDCTFGSAQISLTTCSDCTFTDSVYFDGIADTTLATLGHYFMTMLSSTSDILVDGLTFGGLVLNQPLSGLFNVTTGSSRIKIRNIGTAASPLDMGDARQDGVSWSRVTTSCTVTKTAHRLKQNDVVYVPITSDAAAVTVAAKAVSSVPNANTFIFACLNAGATSGTLSYYPTMSGSVLVSATAAADITLQRVYCNHAKTTLITSDNSVKNLLLESVWADYPIAPVFPALNCLAKNVNGIVPYTAQTATYGTHFISNFVKDIAPNLSGQSWSRSTTTATVTSTDHGLRTGLPIVVNVSSDTAAIVLGVKTVTVLTKDTFTFTCLNAGATSGTLTYNDCDARMGIVMNETTTETVNQVDIEAGTPGFTAAGGIYMPNVNDQVIWEMPSYFKGITGFPIAEPIMAGGNAIARFDITYSIDKNDGNGWSSFKNMYYGRTGASGSAAAFTFTVTDATGVAVGDYAWGTGIAPNAKVTNIATNTITVDIANTGTVSGIARFGYLGSETIPDADLGFKMKVRLKVITATTAAVTALSWYANSTNTSRAYEYPLDLATLTLTGLQTGSDIVILEPGTDNEYINIDANAGTTYDFIYDAGVITDIDIGIFKTGYVPFFIRNLPVTADGGSIPIAQIADRNYSA